MKIKTITAQTPAEFDKAVNEALRKGWTLTKRGVLPACAGLERDWPRVYYAELVRGSQPPDPSSKKHNCFTCLHRDADLDAQPCNICCMGDLWEAREA